ncbi:MAG: aminopeptidase [Clostridiales Family XIII bacterium]|jgi:aminopeptidase|nr:aminopeptidase [Clostridiales Family XIII bacterium]
MTDPRIEILANNLVHYSCKLKEGDRVLVSYEGDDAKPLVLSIIKEAYRTGAHPYAEIRDSEITRALMFGADEAQVAFQNEIALAEMKGMQAYIAVRGGANASELSDVPSEQQNMWFRTMRPTQDYRVNHTNWVVLRYPTPSMAQLAGTSKEAFENYYFDVCNLDYQKMSRAMDALAVRMEKAEQVRITGPGTDLSFSIKGMKGVKCDGEKNIPDGEIYTAPVKDSVSGTLSVNTASEELGFTFENIVLTFENGKIVQATANDTGRINALLDTDEGARYIGEFSFGVNPYILHPMKDTLFDEKIAGSFHFTPGNAYEDADNGNRSAVHWDLVTIQREDYGGGEILFDGELIRKDGLFVPEDLHCLNPENLK